MWRSIGKAGAGQRGGAERAFVHAHRGVGEAPAVAVEHFDIGQQVVAEGDRLGGLQVRKAWHDRVGVRFGLGKQRLHQRHDLPRAHLTRGFDPEAEIERDLVVARPGRVQPAGRFADDLLEARFHIHVDVFQRLGKLEFSIPDLGKDLVQPVGDGLGVGLRDHSRFREHGGMGLRAGDVLLGQTLVGIDGGVYRLHDLVGPGRKPAAPHRVALGSLRVAPARLRAVASGRFVMTRNPLSPRFSHSSRRLASRQAEPPHRRPRPLRRPKAAPEPLADLENVQDRRVRPTGPGQGRWPCRPRPSSTRRASRTPSPSTRARSWSTISGRNGAGRASRKCRRWRGCRRRSPARTWS